jgi:hypothetical protein
MEVFPQCSALFEYNIQCNCSAFSFLLLEVHPFLVNHCSKAILMFEEDERFKAVERPREREDLFENYVVELHKKVF